MDLRAFEAAVEATSDPAELWVFCTAYFRAQAVIRVTYHHLPPLGAPDAQNILVRADGFPEDMVARYVAERMWRDNPMLKHARSSPEPFYWSDVVRSGEMSAREEAFTETFAEALGGAGDGLGVVVFGPNGRNGYCGLGLPGALVPLPAEVVRDLHWACQLAHLRYCALLATRHGAPPALSRRESEVLGWVAHGKSNTSIAEILGISAHTVDAHLRRIFLKLDVGDRISATVRGLGVGLIHAGA